MIEHTNIKQIIPSILDKHIPGFTIETTEGEGEIKGLIAKYSTDDNFIIVNLTDYTTELVYADNDAMVRANFDIWVNTSGDHTTLLKKVISGIAADGLGHGIYLNGVLNQAPVLYESAAPRQVGGHLWLNIKVSIDV